MNKLKELFICVIILCTNSYADLSGVYEGKGSFYSQKTGFLPCGKVKFNVIHRENALTLIDFEFDCPGSGVKKQKDLFFSVYDEQICPLNFDCQDEFIFPKGYLTDYQYDKEIYINLTEEIAFQMQWKINGPVDFYLGQNEPYLKSIVGQLYKKP